MPSRFASSLLVFMLLQQGIAVARDSPESLRINPFIQPQAVVADTQVGAVSAADDVMELRGVMLAGEHSLANIGGKIVAVGQDINGYRLIAVTEDNVVLDRDGTRRELNVRAQGGAGGNVQANTTR